MCNNVYSLFSKYFILILFFFVSSSFNQSYAEGLSLLELMGDDIPVTTALPPKSESAQAISGSLNLNDVQEGRKAIHLQGRIAELNDAVNNLSNSCVCTSSSCYNDWKFGHWKTKITLDNTKDAARRVNSELTQKKREVCQTLLSNLDSSDMSLESIARQTAFTEEISDILTQIDKAATGSFRQIAKQDLKIRKQIVAQRIDEEKNSGFNFGKLAALGVGAAIGGISDLDAASQTELVSAMVTDSFNSGSSVANLKAVSGLNTKISSNSLLGKDAQTQAARKLAKQVEPLTKDNFYEMEQGGKSDLNNLTQSNSGSTPTLAELMNSTTTRPTTANNSPVEKVPNSAPKNQQLSTKKITYKNTYADVTSEIPAEFYGTYWTYDMRNNGTPNFMKEYKFNRDGSGYLHWINRGEPKKRITSWGVLVENNEIVNKKVSYYSGKKSALAMIVAFTFEDGSSGYNSLFLHDGQPVTFGPYGSLMSKK